MHQIFMFLRGFSPAHKNCKKLFSDNFFYRWYKYMIISLQNYLIKLTPNVLIKMYRLYTWHVHRSWWFRHLLQSGDIYINNRNIFVLFLKMKSSNIALSNDTKNLNIAMIKQLDPKCQTRTYINNINSVDSCSLQINKFLIIWKIMMYIKHTLSLSTTNSSTVPMSMLSWLATRPMMYLCAGVR